MFLSHLFSCPPKSFKSANKVVHSLLLSTSIRLLLGGAAESAHLAGGKSPFTGQRHGHPSSGVRTSVNCGRVGYPPPANHQHAPLVHRPSADPNLNSPGSLLHLRLPRVAQSVVEHCRCASYDLDHELTKEMSRTSHGDMQAGHPSEDSSVSAGQRGHVEAVPIHSRIQISRCDCIPTRPS